MLRLYSDRDFFVFLCFGGGGLDLWIFFGGVVFSSSSRLQYPYSVVVHSYPNLRVLFASVKCDPLLYFSLFLLSHSHLMFGVTSAHSHGTGLEGRALMLPPDVCLQCDVF